jgi:hypothetical protein
VLSLTDGEGDVANLQLLFNYAADWSGGDPGAHFTMQDNGHGGTIVTNDITRPPI